MSSPKKSSSEEVAHFLTQLEHPRKAEIELLRQLILNANAGLSETIKWNAPNFCAAGEDRITMRIHPPKHLQLIFHRGAKVLEMPENRLISDDSGLLEWKTNDRAVATFLDQKDIETKANDLAEVIQKWLAATA